MCALCFYRIVVEHKASIAEQLQEALTWMLKNHKEVPAQWVPKLEARYIHQVCYFEVEFSLSVHAACLCIL